ncbi:hypothetical protein AGMMS50293_09070 [Spirochaetia bacterium]|nr:hypothetical protein AGMMS50293_09070 [Spirochaetia bacterium]
MLVFLIIVIAVIAFIVWRKISLKRAMEALISKMLGEGNTKELYEKNSYAKDVSDFAVCVSFFLRFRDDLRKAGYSLRGYVSGHTIDISVSNKDNKTVGTIRMMPGDKNEILRHSIWYQRNINRRIESHAVGCSCLRALMLESNYEKTPANEVPEWLQIAGKELYSSIRMNGSEFDYPVEITNPEAKKYVNVGLG